MKLPRWIKGISKLILISYFDFVNVLERVDCILVNPAGALLP
jgi:hypothetical protein